MSKSINQEEIDLQLFKVWIELSKLRARLRDPNQLGCAPPYPRRSKKSSAQARRRRRT